ncbi:amino acid permease [Desulforamulus ruminis]|uniref:Amino acid permease-associated region n=1 Tax=Desulforamulus ruminis (strain ATCC 23193 / DSM 2154 / NCIMB 8452 / DL) TaxID=696281 RepID=F6DQH4_DESRL|nr:amino acid permease [Desulforamulus ruminis]AEG60868.1 amino acid permease-associated region [Desulforamulus ruminis DSM 2154]
MPEQESNPLPGVSMNEQKFNRGLKSRHLQLIALGGIIGSGYFLGTGYVIDSAGPAACLAYLLGGLIVFCVMLCMGELAVAIPISSSFVTYANDFISPAWACGMGWSYWLTWVFYVPAEMIAAGIIMNHFFPAVGTIWWAIGFGLIITIINLSYVGTFGELEFWLAIIKIFAIIMFVILAILVFSGLLGKEGFMGTSILLGEGGFTPKGSWAVLLTMVIILVNFQGSEIIGLAAGESKEPEKTIPAAVKNVTWRIIALYVIPVFLLVTIFPWGKAGLEESVFAAALNLYGFKWAGGLFSFVVLTAAISCSNSGLYGCTRAVYALAREGMAPGWLGKLNRNGVPQNATFLSIAGCWICVMAYTLDSSQTIFTILLALSGFSGAIAWISICWSQLNFRRKLRREGFDAGQLKFRTPLFPYLTHFAIWIQVACLGVIAFNEDLRISLYIGLPLLILPMIWYKLWGYKLKPAEVNRVKYEDLFRVYGKDTI